MTEPVIKIIEVGCDAAKAFDVFVRQTSTWWPLGGHSVSAGSGEVAQALTIEPIVGGAIYETMYNGERTEWGKVQKFEVGRVLAMTWHPGNNADMPTKVEVIFEDQPGGRAKVTLTHSGWEIWGEKADDMRDGYNGGWVLVFETQFANACG